MSTELSILRILAYFDLFNYPLTKSEIKLFLDRSIEDLESEQLLNNLIKRKLVFAIDGFYCPRNDKRLIENRIRGNREAELLLVKGRKISRFLYQFPFVRGIGISGSVSKKYADSSSDIDYFIITKKDRLWIARTFMHLFKKIPFLKGRKKWYCMNYYVDESALEIEEKNIYTALELYTMIPMYGNGSIAGLFGKNKWAEKYFPVAASTLHFNDNAERDSTIKKLLEWLFENKFGNWLEDYFFRLTTKRWNLKEEQKRLNTKGELMGLRTSKHCSKPSPKHFHNKFLAEYYKRIEELEKKWGNSSIPV